VQLNDHAKICDPPFSTTQYEGSRSIQLAIAQRVLTLQETY
jgi:hypothetical protein